MTITMYTGISFFFFFFFNRKKPTKPQRRVYIKLLFSNIEILFK